MSKGVIVGKCKCGVPLALLKSWTTDNPGRRFLTCKFSNPATKNRGCGFFRWYDEEQVEWQRDVINNLVLEKKVVECNLKMLKCENTHLQDQCEKLKEANGLLRKFKSGGEEEEGIKSLTPLAASWCLFAALLAAASLTLMLHAEVLVDLLIFTIGFSLVIGGFLQVLKLCPIPPRLPQVLVTS
ncbi:uncharacterized protein LOC141639144 [Silene latifolia]|uniref:uncharacterized protein LOC141639144 n=1 Tax=Silene latifolia TaxID=37657 RepID=UPI003D781756